MDTNATLLRAILATVARTAFPPDVLYKIVAPTAGSEKQLVAYNLCNGERRKQRLERKQSSTKATSAAPSPNGLTPAS
jgi:hypothetical protein